MYSLVLDHVNKKYGSVIAVKDIDLSVSKGELISLLGPSGSGKTTILRLIAGFERPDSGQILFEDKPVNNVLPEDRDVGVVFQSYALFPSMNVGQNVAFSLMIQGCNKEKRRKRVSELLDLVKLPGYEERYITQLSGGQQQRVALARSLAKNPKILLLDEPLSALDAKIREELRIEIRRIQSALDMTTIYVTHDQEEALSISDRVVVVNQGTIQQAGSPTQIYRQPSNLFVARFVGTRNLFEVKILDGSSVKWIDLTFTVSETGNFPPGTTATLAVRPEDMTIVKQDQNGTPNWNSLPARVEPLTFLGSTVRVTLRSTADTVLRVDLPAEAASGLSLGQEVNVCFSPDAGVLVKE
jgi:putative spermidine/putrescine transport system ATP-binding protein